MIKLFNGVIDEEKTFIHYVNSHDVKVDTFNYIMHKVTDQCDRYLEAKESKDKKMMNFLLNRLCI